MTPARRRGVLRTELANLYCTRDRYTNLTNKTPVVVPERLTPQAHPDLSPLFISQLLGRRYAPEQLHLSPRYSKTIVSHTIQ